MFQFPHSKSNIDEDMETDAMGVYDPCCQWSSSLILIMLSSSPSILGSYGSCGFGDGSSL